jgi:hypothetical protein
MATDNLPPQLAALYAQLKDVNAPEPTNLRHELELVGKLIQYASESAIKAAPAVRQIVQTQRGFTTAAGDSCKCCGRPF